MCACHIRCCPMQFLMRWIFRNDPGLKRAAPFVRKANMHRRKWTQTKRNEHKIKQMNTKLKIITEHWRCVHTEKNSKAHKCNSCNSFPISLSYIIDAESLSVISLILNRATDAIIIQYHPVTSISWTTTSITIIHYILRLHTLPQRYILCCTY